MNSFKVSFVIISPPDDDQGLFHFMINRNDFIVYELGSLFKRDKDFKEQSLGRVLGRVLMGIRERRLGNRRPTSDGRFGKDNQKQIVAI